MADFDFGRTGTDVAARRKRIVLSLWGRKIDVGRCTSRFGYIPNGHSQTAVSDSTGTDRILAKHLCSFARRPALPDGRACERGQGRAHYDGRQLAGDFEGQ